MWFWILLFISTGFMVGVMYYGCKLALPKAELKLSYNSFFGEGPQNHVIFTLGAFSILYIASIRWIYKTLKPIWG